jgi:hypothetical protein
VADYRIAQARLAKEAAVDPAEKAAAAAAYEAEVRRRARLGVGLALNEAAKQLDEWKR